MAEEKIKLSKEQKDELKKEAKTITLGLLEALKKVGRVGADEDISKVIEKAKKFSSVNPDEIQYIANMTNSILMLPGTNGASITPRQIIHIDTLFPKPIAERMRQSIDFRRLLANGKLKGFKELNEKELQNILFDMKKNKTIMEMKAEAEKAGGQFPTVTTVEALKGKDEAQKEIEKKLQEESEKTLPKSARERIPSSGSGPVI